MFSSPRTRQILFSLAAASVLGATPLLGTACSDDGAFEEAGEDVDEAVDETGDALEDTGDEIERQADDMGD